jgi:Fe-S cluster assembly protein SufD
MTVALTRTKAEQAFAELFEAVAPELPGNPAVAEARKAAIGAFTGLGLPHRRVEEWKYTDLRSTWKETLPPAVAPATPATSLATSQEIDTALGALAEIDAHRIVLVNGAVRPELSTAKAAVGVDVTSLASALATSDGRGFARESVPGQEAVVALNTALMTDGAVIRIAAGSKLTRPILLVHVRAGREPRLITTRSTLDIGAGAEATVIEVHIALAGVTAGQANTLAELSLGEGANLRHVKCTLEGERTAHLASWQATVGAGATYRPFQLTAGTGLVRNHLALTFAGEGGTLDLAACLLAHGAEHIDTTLVIDHAVPGCTSRELVKGVLAGRARGIFQGKVIVRPDAQKTDGKQMAQALMLSEDAEFDSKPELEIFADDVVCGHGSTVAELDDDMLFYLRSRGLPLAHARALLIESFVGEVLDKLEEGPLREALSAIAKGRLASLVGEA